jgi:tRNA-dihydrouridine synthase
MLADPGEVAPVLDRLAEVQPAAVDLNCACPAPKIRQTGAGAELFEDQPRLEAILRALRARCAVSLTVKIRLGRPGADWRERLCERLRLFEDCGVDAVTLHPRFADEKLKRRARHELLPEFAAHTRLPLIASGDVHGPDIVRVRPQDFAGVAGLMVGRMAVVQPWRFAAWQGRAPALDYSEVWQRLVRYVREDFPAPRVFHRARAFTLYYARNFIFGHTLFAAAQAARSLAELEAKAAAFFATRPEPTREPSVMGLN